MTEKKINEMLKITKGSIVDRKKWANGEIDTIVNAAKPTLMGSNQGVDGIIHSTLDAQLGGTGAFKKKICEQLGTKEGDTIIRCRRGQAVLTEGANFCKYIIHVVGAIYDGELNEDGKTQWGKECTSSCLKTLESCYYSIIEEVKKHSDIEVIGIPIVGSGEYKVPFEIAAEVAMASIGNALVEWKIQDSEMFEMAGLREVVFYAYDKNAMICKKKCQCISKIMDRYKPIFQKDRKVVYQNSWKASLRYWREVTQNDGKRGYFAVAKLLRELLLFIRWLFFPLQLIKDLIGGCDWQRRRGAVEWIAVLKLFFSLLCCIALNYHWISGIWKIICVFIIGYFMLDTITYLMTLIVLADVQNPSANIIRSLILLFVNYLETAFDLSFLYYCYIGELINLIEALAFVFFSQSSIEHITGKGEFLIVGANSIIKFFFITLSLGYFMGHMRQRRFRS